MAHSVYPSEDLYQIHRTPFFRRIHLKDSDQLERLKNAYESIRSFDEKPLQMQVKKIRLDKLVLRIKDSLTVSKPKQNKTRPRPKSQHQLRCEELTKARQVGIEYSRNNLNSMSSRSPIPVPTKKQSSQEHRNLNSPKLSKYVKTKKITPQDEWMLKNSQLKRRLEYGNRKSEKNRIKIQQCGTATGSEDSFNNDGFSSSKEKQKRMETLRKLLVHCLSEEDPDPRVIRSFESIALTKNHSYWDLMDAIKKQQQYINRYGEFTKNLSKISKLNIEQNESLDRQVETFQSTTNIRTGGRSEVFIRTYRYSDEDEYLPPPSESLLQMPHDVFDVTDECPIRDDSNDLPPNKSYIMDNDPEGRADLPLKFGDIIRKTVRTESAMMLENLEKAFKH